MKQNQEISVTNPFLSGPILSPLIRFALPLMLSLLLQAFYGGVDLAVVGQYSPTASVSAVATGSQVMEVITSLITGLTMGVTVLLGKAVGAEDPKKAGEIVSGQIKLFSITAVVLMSVMLLFAPQAAKLMNVPQAAMSETVKYIRICSAGIIFITAYNGISGIFRGIGNSRSPFLFVLIACMVNVVLDLLFVGVFNMDASGAALATIIAQAVSVLFSIGYIRRRPLPFSIADHWRCAGRPIRNILKVGSPIALQDFLSNLSFLIITSIVNTLGVIASAGVGISEKLFVFLSIVPMAFMSALSTFVAHNMGAGNRKRANHSLFLAQGISLCVGIVMFSLTFFAGGLLASVFDNDAAVIEATAQYLKGSSLEYLMVSVIFCFLGYFNGREHTAFVMAQGLLSAFLVRIPLSYYFSLLPNTGMFLISLAVPVSAFVNLSLCIIYFFWLRKKDRKYKSSESENIRIQSFYDKTIFFNQ